MVRGLGVTFHARWSASANTFYATSHQVVGGVRKTIHMHRVVAGLGSNWKEIVPDHKDHNGLNNTRANLRVLSKAINHRNMKSAKAESTHGYLGVCFDRSRNVFMVGISGRLNGRRSFLSLGRFEKAEDAGLVAKYAREFVMQRAIADGVIELTPEFREEVREHVKEFI
jgi:hypothetical protein